MALAINNLVFCPSLKVFIILLKSIFSICNSCIIIENCHLSKFSYSLDKKSSTDKQASSLDISC